MSFKIRVQNLLTKRDPTGIKALVLLPLTLAGRLWCAVLKLRRDLYRNGSLKSRSASIPVVCVGNITLGGTGKTPIVEKLCALAKQLGGKPVVISRGYGGKLEGKVALVSDGEKVLLDAELAGDEPVLLAELMGDVPVVIGSDRYAAVAFAAERTGADVAIMDDGFQHLKLRKELNVVVVDASRPFGNGHCIPRGMLREPASALADAGVIVLTRVDRVNAARLKELKAELSRLNPDAPVVEASHAPRYVKTFPDGPERPAAQIEGRKVLAFAGIGRPEGFFSTLTALGAKLTHSVEYADHHPYTSEDLDKLANWARISNAEALVTTEKDGVRLKSLVSAGGGPRVATEAEIWLLGIRMEMDADGVELLTGLLAGAMEAKAAHR